MKHRVRHSSLAALPAAGRRCGAEQRPGCQCDGISPDLEGCRSWRGCPAWRGARPGCVPDLEGCPDLDRRRTLKTVKEFAEVLEDPQIDGRLEQLFLENEPREEIP